MSIFKKWFVDNPSKILGEVVKTRDRWNPDKEIEVVKGEIDNLEKIDVPDSFEPKKGVGLEGISIKKVSNVIQENNVANALNVVEQKKQSKPKKSQKRSKSKKPVNLKNIRVFYPKPDIKLKPFDEAISSLNKGLNEEYIKAWVFYKKSNNFTLNKGFDKYYDNSDEYISKALNEGYLCFDPNEGFIPSVLYYSGNLYFKINSLTKYAGSEISETQKEKQIQKLKSELPKKLTFWESKENRLNINWKSLFAKQFKFFRFGEETTLYDSFFDYVKGLEASDMKYFKKGSGMLIYKHIFLNKNFTDVTEQYKNEFIRQSSEELDYQIYKFITQSLDSEIQKKIELKWNVEHNGFKEPNYNLIPVGFDHNEMFVDAPLKIKPEQVEGVSFMDISGNGIIAFDVGLGKTMTSILTIGNAISNGQCKRPIIVVPNPTYFKWLSELHGTYDEDGNVISHGILPQYRINNWYNLDKQILSEIWNPETGLNEPIPEYTITLITYEGLAKLGFSESVGNEFINRVADILTQTEGRTTRERNKDFLKAVEMVSKAEKGSVVHIDQCQFDYLVIDEAHNCNRIFNRVENNDDSKQKGRTYSLEQGEPSVRGTKAFFLSNYIQYQNGGRNVCLLTATPFNNNPLEVYSILALTDLQKLKNLGIANIRTFFDEYIFTTYEKVVKAGNKIETKQVVKGWNNKVSLQSIMFSIMNYKSGEEVNVQRPNKFTLPKVSEVLENGTIRPLPVDEQIKTYLLPTDRQKSNFIALDQWYENAKKDEELKAGADLVLITKGMSNTFSPHVFEKVDVNRIDPIDFIEESSKLKYTMECIKSILKHHKKTNTPVGGIIIYSNTGVAYFDLIKRYLEEELGYKKEAYKPVKKAYSEVEIIASNITEKDKETIKKGFLQGKIKVIIGSATIREGIDLQKRTTTVFNLHNEWNPTAYKQLEGRAWRYGNKYKNVRIVTPLLIDSSDAFIWQKLEEKTARINDIFDRKDKTNILDVHEEDRDAIKWSIMQDTSAIASEMIKEEIEQKEGEIKIIEGQIKKVQNLTSYQSTKLRKENEIKTIVDRWKEYDPNPEESQDFIDIFDRISQQKSSIRKEIYVKNYSLSERFNESFRLSRSLLREYNEANNKLNSTINYIITTFGSEMVDNVEFVTEQLNEQLIELKEVTIPSIKSPEYKEELVNKLDEQRKKSRAGADTFENTVKAFESLNYLLDEIAKKPDTEEEKREKEINKVKKAIESLYLMVDVVDEEEKELYQNGIDSLELMLTAL